jgi:N-succinyldiaminopimelate aminotransferase
MSIGEPQHAPDRRGFYLWPSTGGDDEQFTRERSARAHVTVRPGSCLARARELGNPGAGRLRISLVPPLRQCVEAAERIRDFLRMRAAAVRNSRA